MPVQPGSRDDRQPPLIGFLIAFFVSGACGLAYEVVWTRLLGLAIGHTTVALTAVVAAYMGGLAAGSAWIGRLLRRGVAPGSAYAALEAGIALLALIFPLQLSLVTWLSAEVGQVLERGSFALGVVRFLLAAVAVFPATFLMGGTLPAMLEAVPRGGARSRDGTAGLARNAGVLYAVNTSGAVVGAALAGFVSIERLGTLETTWIAAAGNLIVAVATLLMARPSHQAWSVGSGWAERNRPSSESEPSLGAGARDVLVAYAISGFAAMALQVVWTRGLVFYAGSTTYAFTGMLIVYLGGIAIGTAVASPLVERLRHPVRAFVAIQAALALAAAGSLHALQLATPVVDSLWPPELSWATLVGGNFVKAMATMAVPTLLMGVLFPVAVRVLALRAGGAPSGAGQGQSALLTGRLYAMNTVGGIAGTALAGLVLIPAFGIRESLLCASLSSLGAGLLLARHHDRRVATTLLLSTVGVMATLLTIGGQPLHAPVGSERLVFYEEGSSGTVSVLEEVTGTRTIYIDRVPVAGTDAIMLTDQKSLAHVPMLVHPKATRVLTVGFGSGGASWSFAQHRGVERIDAVEIDPTVFRAAPLLDDSNHGVWRDPRFQLVLEDARNYLASTDATYDIISTDCTDLRYKTNANLYTVDYFSLVRDRLRPGGLVTVWMPLGGLGGDTFRMALRTFRHVFPHTTVWYMTNQPTHYLLLVGSDREMRPDPDAIAAAMTEEVRRDLAEIRLEDPLKVASSLLLDEHEVARFVGEGPLNTDRHPLLEFQAPRLAYRDALAMNLRTTAAARDRQKGLQRWGGTPDATARLEPYVRSTPALIEGHARYQLGTFDYAAALRLYRAAARLNPADASIPLLVSDVERTRAVWLNEFGTRTTSTASDPRDWIAYATLLRQADRLPDAIAAGRHATERAPTSVEAWVKLAATHTLAGDRRAAVETLERAQQLVPEDAMLLSDLGAAYNEQERFADAETVLRHSLTLQETPDAHNNLGVALNGQERAADAIRVFGRALELNDASADAWFNLGVSHAVLGDLAQARTAYQRGLALAPDEPRALRNLALIEAQAGHLDLTVRYLSTAVEQTPTSAELHNELGRALLGLKRVPDAIRAFERALALDPASSAVAENLKLARSSTLVAR